MTPKLLKHRNAVMAKLKARCRPGWQIHHIFSRPGRLAACEFFCCEMKVRPGAASHHDKTEKLRSGLRDHFRPMLRMMEKANIQNMSQATCWWQECAHAFDCPLYENGPSSDGPQKKEGTDGTSSS